MHKSSLMIHKQRFSKTHLTITFTQLHKLLIFMNMSDWLKINQPVKGVTLLRGKDLKMKVINKVIHRVCG